LSSSHISKNKPKKNNKPREQDVKKPRRSLFDHVINLISVLILIALVYVEYGHLRAPATPMAEYTALYEKHTKIIAAPPFAMSYHLLLPDNYDPQKKYPLVLALRGVSNYVYAGMFLAGPAMRQSYPAFVVVPIVSKRSVWAAPSDKQYGLQRKGLRFPAALPQAMAVIRDLQSRYAIDPTRIYVTGHSAGGIGAFGALQRYPDIFAAGVIVSGLWDPMDAPSFLETPFVAFHGGADRQIPAPVTAQLLQNIKDLGGSGAYIELPGAGHDIWQSVYANPDTWNWLFSQKK